MPRTAARSHVLPLRYAYGDNDIKDALLLVATRLGRSPKPAEYQSERLRIHAERKAAGDLRTIPTVDVVRTRYGVWNAALAKAGLQPVKGQRQPALGLSSPLYSEAEKLEWIRRAWTECGEPFTQAAYKHWREKRMKRTGETIPGVGILVRAFGGWQNARARALPGHSAPRE
jgi:Homing endonuclease associated repeat